jgi:hypothetical protein
MNESSEPTPSVNPDCELSAPAPTYGPLPSSASWEAGYKMSLIALEKLKDQPEFWEERRKDRCYVEFKL